MAERIQKILSACGVCSRREAERLIQAGRVCVNGQAAALGDRADPDRDEILVDGRPISAASARLYIMLNKPRGYVTTCDDERGRPTVTDLVRECGARVYPVGRLDLESEGLLLLTNDGDFAQRLMHPSHAVEKTYLVRVAPFCKDTIRLLRRPVTLDGYTICPPTVELAADHGTSADLRIVIHEGRNRQIRRMCELAGTRVLSLRRIAEGAVALGGLPPGQWRLLTEAEIAALLA